MILISASVPGTKDTKVVNLCLQVIQRLITAQVLDGKGAKYVVETTDNVDAMLHSPRTTQSRPQ